MSAEVQKLIAQVGERFPEARLEFRRAPSGVCWFDVWIGDRSFELEFDPRRGTGISEATKETTPFSTGHDRVFSSLDQGAKYFQELLESAAPPPVSEVLTEQIR